MIGEIITIKDGLGNIREIKKIKDNNWIRINAPYGNNKYGEYLVPTFFQDDIANFVEQDVKINPRYFRAWMMVDRRTYGV
jgi:hypothetical protein